MQRKVFTIGIHLNLELLFSKRPPRNYSLVKIYKKKHALTYRDRISVEQSIQWAIWLSICPGVLRAPIRLSIASRRKIMPRRASNQDSKMLFVSVYRILEGAVFQRILSWKISTPSSGQKVYPK